MEYCVVCVLHSMKRILFYLPVAIVFSSACSSRVSQQDSSLYLREAVAFLKDVARIDFKEPGTVIMIQPTLDEEGLKDALANTVEFSPAELAYIRDKKYPVLERWPTQLLPAARWVESDTVRNIFNKRELRWTYFNRQYGNRLVTYSAPIFLRNSTYCIFQAGYSCGSLCGAGNLSLYQKKNGSWQLVKSYFEWIN